MALDVDDQRELEGQAVNILDGVELKSFKAPPQTIEPFEEAQLSWDVTGSDPRFSV